MLHTIGTLLVWYIAIVVGVRLLAWAVVGAVSFSRQIACAALILAILAAAAWLLTLEGDQLVGLAIGSSILLFVAAAPFVGYRLLHGGRNLEQEIAHRLASERKAMGYDA